MGTTLGCGTRGVRECEHNWGKVVALFYILGKAGGSCYPLAPPLRQQARDINYDRGNAQNLRSYRPCTIESVPRECDKPIVFL